jgi:hypothetical protein
VAIHRSIADDHPYFDECLQLYLLNLATFAIGLHLEAQKDARHAFEIVNVLHSAFKARENEKAREISAQIGGEWDLPDYPEEIRWQSLGSDEDCVLHVSQSVVDFARRGEHKPTSLMYEVVPTTQTVSGGEIELPEAPEGLVAVDGAVPTRLFETVLAYLVGGSYERFNRHFQSKYGRNWPPELQFFRHLRNGCFHRNEFRIDRRNGTEQIDPSNPPKWHTYVMPSDAAMNGKKVIGEIAFFHQTHLLLLLDDMGTFA